MNGISDGCVGTATRPGTGEGGTRVRDGCPGHILVRLTATPPLTSGHRPPFRFCPLDLETTFSVAAAFVDGRSSQPTQEEERMKPRCVEDGRTEGRRDESVQLGEEEPVFQTACTTETRRDKVGWRRRRRRQMERRCDRLPSPCGRNSAEPHGD